MSLNLSGLSAYTDQNRMPLVTKTLFGGKTASVINKQVGIKSAAAINIMATDAIFQSATCGWSASGTTTLTQRNITVGSIQVSESLCPASLEAYWTQTIMSPGWNTEIPFEQSYTDYKVKMIQKQLEVAIWQGDTTSGNANLSRFDGLKKLIDAASGPVQTNVSAYTTGGPIASATGITITNAWAIMQGFANAFAGGIPDILGSDDVAVFCGWDTFAKLIQNCINLNLFHFDAAQAGVVGEFTIPGFNFKVIAVHGLDGTNRLFGGRTVNFYFGTDLKDEEEKFRMWWSDDNQEVRFITHFKAGTNIAIPDQVATFTLA